VSGGEYLGARLDDDVDELGHALSVVAGIVVHEEIGQNGS